MTDKKHHFYRLENGKLVDFEQEVDGYTLQVDETPYAEVLAAKRPVASQFATPSRLPVDSAVANGSASTDERVTARTLEEAKKQLRNLRFTHERSTGYADTRSSGDLVEDVTPLNLDQELLEATAYLKPVDPELNGGKDRPLSNGGTFAGDQDTKAKREQEALEAASRKLQEAREGGDLKTLVEELYTAYPELRSLDGKANSDHPAFKLGKLYSDSLNVSRLSSKNKTHTNRRFGRRPS